MKILIQLLILMLLCGNAYAASFWKVMGSGVVESGSSCTTGDVILGQDTPQEPGTPALSANNVSFVGPYTATESCNISVIGTYVGGLRSGEFMTLGIYSNNGGVPGTKLRDTSSQEGSTDTYYDVTLDSVYGLTSGDTYFLAMGVSAGTAYPTFDYTADGSGTSVSIYTLVNAFTAGTLPADATGATLADDTSEGTIYATAE